MNQHIKTDNIYFSKIIKLVFILLLFSNLSLYAKNQFEITPNSFYKITKKYGFKARKRVLLLISVLEDAKDKDILYKLKAANNFWNRVVYRSDPIHWRKEDYWASPFEFIGTGAGDCEDYAIAKYFMLRQLGVPKKKLKLSHVMAKQNSEEFTLSHIVLTYYHTPNSTPIVLDNLKNSIELLTKRDDLMPLKTLSGSVIEAHKFKQLQIDNNNYDLDENINLIKNLKVVKYMKNK